MKNPPQRPEPDEQLDRWLSEAVDQEQRELANRDPRVEANRFWARLEPQLDAPAPILRIRPWMAAAAAVALLAIGVGVWSGIDDEPPVDPAGLAQGSPSTPGEEPEDLAAHEALLDELDVLIALDATTLSAVTEVGADVLDVGESLELLQEDAVDDVLAMLLETSR